MNDYWLFKWYIYIYISVCFTIRRDESRNLQLGCTAFCWCLKMKIKSVSISTYLFSSDKNVPPSRLKCNPRVFKMCNLVIKRMTKKPTWKTCHYRDFLAVNPTTFTAWVSTRLREWRHEKATVNTIYSLSFITNCPHNFHPEVFNFLDWQQLIRNIHLILLDSHFDSTAPVRMTNPHPGEHLNSYWRSHHWAVVFPS